MQSARVLRLFPLLFFFLFSSLFFLVLLVAAALFGWLIFLLYRCGQCVDGAVMAEWLRRWTRNPMGYSRAGSNPVHSERDLLRRREGGGFWSPFSAAKDWRQ